MRWCHRPSFTIKWVSCPFLLLLLVLSGCISPGPVTSQSEGFSWHYFKVRFVWPEGERPEFSYHPMVADRMFGDIVESLGGTTLWRFHRRAKRDGAGHQFSFIIQTDSEKAEYIRKKLEASELVNQLKRESVIKELQFSDSGDGSIEAASDQNWPPEIQRTWPWFAMGVSQSWLALVQDLRPEETNVESIAVPEMLKVYSDINDQITAVWLEYGSHAYFHHMNALFGYEPVYLYDTGELRAF